ncbi:hypothetical protein [Desulfosporosinus sp. BICA1-9]|uniref:hypothetical protein n=1 Tax=Desulfosporosinus sp. BICA1-9 TaxID=1531958 RepID=UPI00054B51E6|nr:hypothetical protein [Desulfosporosinus sp. BICA1-9]KJS50026.1 MAG: hypothetical protein VR66_05195 [Peptococcaceae bacterium BRH_c23]KJS85643.1 MAG: hypothetical protein JL57_18430 [Desulfosporosinus sp. BICA1-9]HBW34489.1 hypothetical protein [Desulfosporosinus sp.]
MPENKRKILILVEGAKTDTALMARLLAIYGIDAQYKIVSYCTNIYTLYSEMFVQSDPSVMDLLQLLKAREPASEKKPIFDTTYTDVLLIFDLDPQAPDFSPEKIRQMAEYFVESSDMGKLYLNYPMVESFYHMSSIPDDRYNDYVATLDELQAGTYKIRVNRENRNHDYRKFAVNKEECNVVIQQNINKARHIIHEEPNLECIPEQAHILEAQLALLSKEYKVAVLSTCPFFISDYSSTLIHNKQ